MGGTILKAAKTNTAIVAAFAAFLLPSYARTQTPLTAGVILKEMPARELAAYVTGIVEGLAYARFRTDSLKAGQKVQTGMDCIRNWYFSEPNRVLAVENAFR